MTNLEKECWMRDFNYEDYVIACNRSWVTPLSKETYYEMCSSYEDAMWNEVESWKGYAK